MLCHVCRAVDIRLLFGVTTEKYQILRTKKNKNLIQKNPQKNPTVRDLKFNANCAQDTRQLDLTGLLLRNRFTGTS